jgi:dienelactone hydrolase
LIHISFKPQTLQGADILADELNAQVLMPDFFEGDEPWPLDKFPPKTDEDKKRLQEWFGGFANPKNHTPKLLKVGQELKSQGVSFVMAYGYCWGRLFFFFFVCNVKGLKDIISIGGKVVMKSGCGDDTPFDAISIIHPAYVLCLAYNMTAPLSSEIWQYAFRRGCRGPHRATWPLSK